jgi:hypothetical protein
MLGAELYCLQALAARSGRRSRILREERLFARGASCLQMRRFAAYRAAGDDLVDLLLDRRD